MGSPCELLVDAESTEHAEDLTQRAANEAWRIEDKFSRYIDGNVVHRINTGRDPVTVDPETAQLLDFADTLYDLSDGAFDITSGVLRKAWKFDGSDRIPTDAAVTHLLSRVGWRKVRWSQSTITLPDGMEIDLGGIAKEYAVDKTCEVLKQVTDAPCLVNFGGDLAVTGPPASRPKWRIGIDVDDAAAKKTVIQLRSGALASSGDSRRFLIRNGTRYGHVLDPRTGWPVCGAPASITVAAATCTQAGVLTTLAMLKGEGAENFLEAQAEQFWCFRSPKDGDQHP